LTFSLYETTQDRLAPNALETAIGDESALASLRLAIGTEVQRLAGASHRETLARGAGHVSNG